MSLSITAVFVVIVAVLCGCMQHASATATGSTIENSGSSADSAAQPLYLQELYGKLQRSHGPLLQTLPAAANSFQFSNSASAGSRAESEQIERDHRAMSDYLSGVDKDGWQPFRRDLAQLRTGASAIMFSPTITTITVPNTGHHAAAHNDFTSETAPEPSSRLDRLDLLRFSLPSGKLNGMISASLNLWWLGPNATAASAESAEDQLSVQFELGLKRGGSVLRTAVKSTTLSSLTRRSYISVDLTAALQVWQAFFAGASDEEARILGTDDAVGPTDFSVLASIHSTDEKSGERRTSLVESGAFSTEGELKPLLLVTKEMSEEELPELELSEEGIRELEQQESHRRLRRQADQNAKPPGPEWATEPWRTEQQSCQHFTYTIKSEHFKLKIVSPKEINLNICHGACRVPFTSHVNASTHATLTKLWAQQMELRSRNLQDAESFGGPPIAVHCVPVSFDATQILFATRGLVTYRDLTSTACGCR